MPLTLRRASPTDVEKIVEVFLSCWKGNYSRVLPWHVLQSMTEERARALWERVLSTSDGEEEVTVAVDAETGDVRGVARHGPGHPGHGIIWSLYVDPASQGSGIGSRLLRGAESSLRQAGAKSASLWVFADNAASITFYAHHGWLPDSEPPARGREFDAPTYRLSKSFPAKDPATGDRGADEPATAAAVVGGISP